MKRIVLIALAVVVACGGGSATTTAAPTTSPPEITTATTTDSPSTTAASSAGGTGATVGVSDFAFSPSTVTIKAGETVTWNLTDGAHTSTSGSPPDGDGLWSQTLDPNTPFTFTFDEPGEYAYFCRFHQDFMTGTVVVEP